MCARAAPLAASVLARVRESAAVAAVAGALLEGEAHAAAAAVLLLHQQPLAEVARTLFALSWLAPLRVLRARRR